MLRKPPGRCALRRGADGGNSQYEQPAANSRAAPYFYQRAVSRLLAVRLLPRPEALSSTASPGAGASPPPLLTPPNCLNGTSEASGVSFGRAWACEQRKAPRRGAEAGGAVLVPFAKTKGTPGAGRKAPAGSHFNHSSQPHRPKPRQKTSKPPLRHSAKWKSTKSAAPSATPS